ncbi:MAG TPA: two-component system sensor histidine kinase KdpD [Burkholderiales bacterium]|nr:two-component system sensor histidine kinase KdpD [Burkholderiales bacterium]
MPVVTERHPERPDPDALLERLQRGVARAGRGHLRIYFGSSAGVGKTYAMLAAAQKRRAEGEGVLIGVIETHGRTETAALLQDLEVLPPAQIEYRGRTLQEFDLDGALKRHPPLILVDELAHTNAPGARHPKRWQDVKELLDAGIDVYSTLNIQHLESLNDVVGGITGVRVAETLPDTFFDAADEVVLVDIPADELLTRLKSGKVYLPAQAEHAAKNFFRKGNLMALRELALRRTADRVEGDVQAYRVENAIDRVWKTEGALLCCIGPGAEGERLVRAASRLAQQLNVSWQAVYVETPALQRLSAAAREHILATVRLAQELGAATAVLPGNEVAATLVDYARSRNLSTLVIGRGQGAAWPWARRQGARIATLAPDVDLIEIARGEKNVESAPSRAALDADADAEGGDWSFRGYAWAVGSCILTSLIATPLLPYFDLANIVMLFLLAVVLVALRFGRGPAVVAAFASVAAFDFSFVPPRFSFAITDVQYLLTFGVMLAVGLITGQLTAGLKFQARVADHREQRSRALFELARDLSSALEASQVVELARAAIGREFRADTGLYVLGMDEQLHLPPSQEESAGLDAATAQWAFDRAQPAGLTTGTLPGSAWLYLPLKAAMRTRGVLALKPASRRLLMIPEQRRQLDTFAALVAIALERVHYVEVAQGATVKIESERLRNSLLSAMSHDLRTPLAALYGLADTLALTQPPLTPAQLEIADAMRAEARRMNALVANLLDMARIQSGEIRLNLQWQPLEEVVGSALQATRAALGKHVVRTDLPRELPLVRFDAVLIERVLGNLLENAAKYAPQTPELVIAARVTGDEVVVSVSDLGPGVPPGQEEAIFEKFTRGERESATPGIGLGLAICRAIVQAHQGRIWVDTAYARGARFCFTLPLGTPPVLPEIDENA